MEPTTLYLLYKLHNGPESIREFPFNSPAECETFQSLQFERLALSPTDVGLDVFPQMGSADFSGDRVAPRGLPKIWYSLALAALSGVVGLAIIYLFGWHR